MLSQQLVSEINALNATIVVPLPQQPPGTLVEKLINLLTLQTLETDLPPEEKFSARDHGRPRTMYDYSLLRRN